MNAIKQPEDPVVQAYRLTFGWLYDDAINRRGQLPNEPNPLVSYNDSMHGRLPTGWERFQTAAENERRGGAGDPTLRLRSSDEILRVCRAAREARVWGLVIAGAGVRDADEQSLDEGLGYLSCTDTLRASLPDSASLILPFHDAIVEPASGGTPLEESLFVYERVMGLVVRHLVDQRERYDLMVISAPGDPSDDLQFGAVS